MKGWIFIATLFVSGLTFGQGALGEVVGTVMESETSTAYGAIAYIDDNGGAVYRSRTDADGRFRISAIPAGTYVLKLVHLGDTMDYDFIVEVPMEGFYQLGTVQFTGDIQILDDLVVTYERDGLIMIDGNLPVKTITSEDLQRSPAKNDIKSLLVSTSTDVRMTNDGELVFRGARKGDMLYLIDGVKATSVGAVPSSSIGRMQIYSGGLPAKYGDTMGGVVVMESKSYFDLYRKWEAEEIKAGRR